MAALRLGINNMLMEIEEIKVAITKMTCKFIRIHRADISLNTVFHMLHDYMKIQGERRICERLRLLL